MQKKEKKGVAEAHVLFNMDDSHDRRRHMERCLKQGIPYERIVPFP